MDFKRMTLILGAPRSGTSWIGKIFDSHPDVLYRHEPDLAIWEPRMPFLLNDRQSEQYAEIAAAYMQRLALTPTLKSVGVLPLFPKSYYAFHIHLLHTAMIHACKWTEKVVVRKEMRDRRIPDLFSLDRHKDVRVVIKSVIGHGRSGAFMNGMPEARFIFLLRHPCGQVASTLRGYRQGKFATQPFTDDVLLTPGAQKYDLNRDRVEAMDDIEALTWHWVVMNEIALDAFTGHSNARVAIYDKICADPIPSAKELFAFSNLSWNPQTEAFIRYSISRDRTNRYYGVFRDPIASANRWRSELSAGQQTKIFDIVRQTALAAFWPETADAAVVSALTH